MKEGSALSFRTVVIRNKCKLSYKNGYLIVRNMDLKMIHLGEINTIIIESTAVVVTSYLICELNKNKIKVIFCDEDMNPQSEIVPYYGAHNTSKKISDQLSWPSTIKNKVWTMVIKNKIQNQAKLLKKLKLKEYIQIEKYVGDIEVLDVTNREGHAAKVYFHSLFGLCFNRECESDINAALNYGYTILLSCFNREIVSKGYLTQIGLKHKNQFNFFNLSSDLMEPFRCIVDEYVYKNQFKTFDMDYKLSLINLLNSKIKIKEKEFYLTNAIDLYLNGIFKALMTCDTKEILLYNIDEV